MFFFYFYFDTYGFYVDPGLGNMDHTHHHPINRSAEEAGCRPLLDTYIHEEHE